MPEITRRTAILAGAATALGAPRIAKAAHTQHAEYLDVLHEDDGDWNASDYAHHLSRRARGLP